MYETPNTFAYMQKKQLMWLLGGFFVAIVAAMTFSAILVNSLVKGQVNALTSQARYATAQIQPAAVTQSTDSSSCVAPGLGGGEGQGQVTGASTTNAGGFGGGQGVLIHHDAVLPVGGMGGGAGAGGNASGNTVSGSSTFSYSYAITRNVNSNNTIGSNNGSGNTSTVNNTQGSYNTVSGHGELNQLNLAKNEAENSSKVIIKDTANTTDSNNNTSVDVTKTIDSNNTENKTITKDSNNDNSVTTTTTNTVTTPESTYSAQ